MASQVLTLSGAAGVAGCATQTLRARVEREDIRAQRVARGGGQTLRFSLNLLLEDLELLRCRFEGCRQYGLGESGGCKAHAPALSLSGRPRPPDVVERIAAGHRKHGDGEHRFCGSCGKPLGKVLGCDVVRGRGRFCSRRCAMTAREAPKKLGAETSCPGCGMARYLRASALAAAPSGYCRTCWDAVPPERRAIASVSHARVEERWRSELVQRKASDELLDTQDVVGLCGLRSRTVHRAAARGELQVVRFGDGRRLLFPDPSVRRWLIAIARSDHHVRLRWRTVDFAVAQLLGHGALESLLKAGLSELQALAVIRVQAEEDVARRRQIVRHRRGRRAGAPAARLVRWQARLAEVHAELAADYAARGWSAPSRYVAAQQLAVEDALAHNADWPAGRYPLVVGQDPLDRDFASPAVTRGAANRILTAVNRLEMRVHRN